MPKYTVVEGILKEFDSDAKTVSVLNKETMGDEKYDLLPEFTRENG